MNDALRRITRPAARGSLVVLACCLPLLALSADDPGRPAPAGGDAASATYIEADVRFLADDLLEGREAGTRGYDLAAAYVATRFRQLGLEPAGEDGGYLQRVPMLRGTRERDGARVALTRDGRTTEFAFETDCLPGVNYTRGAAEVTAPLVFAGQAVRAPELDYDDLAGVDVKGKIVVLLDGAPARFPTDQRAFHASSSEKLGELERLGAVGVIYLNDPVNEGKRSWAVGAANWRRPGMRRIGADGRPEEDFPGLVVRAACRVAVADALFAGSAHTAAEVYAMLDEGRLQSFDLAGTATLATRGRIEPVVSHNVVGRLPGGEARLAGEHVVFTAHLDHLGIGAPKDGDAIYNGAQDNAVGVATMLETARLLATEPRRPARSMLFVALTAEEKGLLGALHFASQPTVPATSMVANVNLDMPLLLAETGDVIAIGLEHSSLDEVTRRVVDEAALSLTVDPFPEEVIFVRSDQYAFVRAGIPAIYLNGGIRPGDGGDGLQRFHAWLANHYHRPSDDLRQPISWTAAARLARLNHRIGMMIGNDPQRPSWKPGDFFGEKFGR